MAPALVLGFALAWAAPARAARAWEKERSEAAALIAAEDAVRVEAALTLAAYRAVSPADFAAEVVRALDGTHDGVSPAADALLRALFGRILQAMSLGQGPAAVFAAPQVSEVPPTPTPALAPDGRAGRPATTIAQLAPTEGARPVPREARPDIQTLGP